MSIKVINANFNRDTLKDINENFQQFGNVTDTYDILKEKAKENGTTLDEYLRNLGEFADTISPENTTFIIPDTNLFNKSDVIKGGYYTNEGYWASNASFITSDFIPITPNTTYTTNVKTMYSHLAFWDKDKKFVAGIKAGTWEGTFTAPNENNIKYVTFAFNISENMDVLMFVKGNTLPSEYAPFKLKLSDAITLNDKQLSKFITTENIDINKSKNLFNYKTMITNEKEIGANGAIRGLDNSALLNLLEIDPSNKYLTISNLPIYQQGYNRAYSFYNANKQPLKLALTSDDSIYRLYDSKTIAIPSNAKYFSINLHSNKTSSETLDYSKTQIEYGDTATAFEPYSETLTSINGYKIGDLKESEESITADKNLLVFGDSITETATLSDDGTSYKEGTRSNWLTWTRRDLPFKEIWNHAKHGAAYKDRPEVVKQQNIRFQVSTAIAQKRPADIIIIAAGTNDGNVNLGDYNTAMSKEKIEDLDRSNLYEALRWVYWTIQSQKDWEKALKFVSLPIQRAAYEPVQSLHKAIADMARRYGFIVIDMNTESQILRDFEVEGGQGRDLYDGLHPNEAGQKKMSKVFNKHISNGLTGRF